MVRIASITANIQGVDFGRAMADVRKAIAEAGPAPDGKTKVDLRGQIVPFNQLYEGFSSGLIIAIVVIFLLLCANFQSLRLALVVISTMPAVLAGVVLALFFTRTTINIQSAMGAIMAVGVAVANAILLVTFADRARLATRGDRRAGAIEGAVSRLRPILMTSFAMIAGMMPLALGTGQTAPLGRAVVGGLALATVSTLLVLPAVFALLASKKATSASLDPEDEQSALYEELAPVPHHVPPTS
jgi:multidrug efflux pump subunit AcrB